MRFLGIDVGDKRVGLAISDELGLTAQGLKTLKRRPGGDEFADLIEIIKEWGVTKIIAGLPRNMNGTYGPQSEKVRKYVNRLTEAYPIEVVFQDERLTTSAAQRTLLEGDVSRKKRKEVVDKIAAVFILQGYMDRLKR